MSKETKKTAVNFKIGQIVYILSNSGQAIIPAMIVEQHVVSTLQGKKASWKLAMGRKAKRRIVDSAEIDGEVYSSLEDVRAVLETKLLAFIDDMTAKTIKFTNDWYGEELKTVNKEAKPPSPKPKDGKINPEDILEDLNESSGVMEAGMAHVVSPAQDNTNLSAEAQKKDLQQRIKQMAEVSDEELAEEIVGEEHNKTPMGFIEGPNGSKIPVNLKA